MNVSLTRLEVPDYDLGLRGKLLRSDKIESGSTVAFCTIVHGLSLVDEVADTPTSNAANGYPDAMVTVDEDTRIALPWLAGEVSAVIGDLATPEGEPIPTSARGQVRRLQSRYAALGLVPVLGFEYEVWVHHAGAQGTAVGRTENAYSLSRLHEVHDVAVEFVDRMEGIGCPVEAFHSELGPGFFEFALKPQPALKAADGAARARQFFRELCAERGPRASFMAKPYADRSGAGGHVHSSLTRSDANVFATGPGQISQTGNCYLAGLLHTLADFTVLFNPLVNSYKRLDKEMFVAEAATWGLDDRSAALRVLVDTTAGARVEHRRPGADASPYLVVTGLLAGGLVGLEEGLQLPAAGQGSQDAPLPADLGSAVERFEESHHAKNFFGEEFVQGYAATRRSELAHYQRWLRTTITDWELQRYGDHL